MIISTRSLASERSRRREARIRQLEQERDQREAEIFERVPRLGEIKAIQAEIGLDLARLMLRAPTRFRKSFEELREWSAQLAAERDELLKRHRIDPQELEVHWDCPDCKNTGWLPPEETAAGTVRPPRKCHCLLKEELEDTYRAAGLTGPLREQTFERFDLTVYPPAHRDYMERLAAYCRGFAERICAGSDEESILLMGDVGLGKTFLCSAIANLLVAAKRQVVYFTLSEFMDLVRLYKFEDDADYRDGIQRLLDADLIILDDLGAEKVTEFAGQELFNIINHRMNRQKPMVISTNLTPGEIQEIYGARIASRILNGFEALVLKGDDVRRVLRRRRANLA